MSRSVVARGERWVVLDDFFEQEALLGLRRWARDLPSEFRPSVIDPADGGAWRSRTLALDGAGDGVPGAVDEVVGAFALPEVPWDTDRSRNVRGAVWRYPPGSGLGWHNDAGGGRVGEFICFLHEEWRADWGGELVVVDRPAERVSLRGDERTPSVRDFVDASGGLGQLIAPRPNRVVFVKAGTAHTIKRVDPRWAGEHRLTLTGFVTERLAVDRGRARQLVQGLAR